MLAVVSSKSVVKRRGSPSSLASEEPNPKRTEECVDSSLFAQLTEAYADSSLISQLVNDKVIEGLACVLALDDNVVGMAEKLFEGAKSIQGIADLDAWQYFTSLHIWQSDKLIQYLTKLGPEQQHLDQQMQETKARISDDPSFKPLFAAKEHIRIVLILVILSLSREDTWTRIEEDELEKGYPCCFFDIFSFDDDHVRLILPPPKGGEQMVNNLADELKKDDNIVQMLRELLRTVQDVSPQGAEEHFDKVKEVWGNSIFIDHLLKFEYNPRSPKVSDMRLSKYIRSLIKKDPLFELILVYNDPAFRMRVALSVLIGFWSNQGVILPLVCTMGGDALGEKEPSEEGKEESPRNWMSSAPSIMDIYRDKSIGELANQLLEEPKAVRLAKDYLKTLKLGDCKCSHEAHAGAAYLFWCQPSVILKFKEAMKKDPNLVKVLTRYSKGAETLRRQEKMSHIRKDVQWELQAVGLAGPGIGKGTSAGQAVEGTVRRPELEVQEIDDSDDSDFKMRLALNILFGYWVDRDVTMLFRFLWDARQRTGNVVCSSENDEKVAFLYHARSATDVESLESWLAKKYGKGSGKAVHLAKKIGNCQMEKVEEAKKRGYSDGPISIQFLLNGSSILTFTLCWFDPSICDDRFEIQLCFVDK